MSGGSISKDQKYLLVKLVSTDQELLRAKFSATTKGSQRRWSAIAEQLNDIPGQSMEWKQWRLVSVLKYNLPIFLLTVFLNLTFKVHQNVTIFENLI